MDTVELIKLVKQLEIWLLFSLILLCFVQRPSLLNLEWNGTENVISNCDEKQMFTKAGIYKEVKDAKFPDKFNVGKSSHIHLYKTHSFAFICIKLHAV